MGDESGRSRGEALPRGAIVGREVELRAITHLFEDVPRGGPRALLLAGPPGIGKTTVWIAGLDEARERGFRVLESRAAGSDAKLSYATLADLVGDAIDSVGDDVVPRPQRRAVDVAFLRADDEGDGVDGRAVALATLATLRALSDDRPVVIAVDDVQWIDGPSAAALSFALRRLRTERIVVFATLREAPGMGDPLELRRTFPGAAIVGVGPMNVEELGTLLRARTRGQISRSMLLRIHAASGGNPFFAIEIVRALERTGSHPAPGEPLPVPEDLGTLLLTRIRALPAATRHALLVASAALHPSVMLVRSALGSSDDVLAPAEETDIVRIVREEIAFTHPLLAAAVYRGASLDRRRTVHRRLAETVGDAEERARHLALSMSSADPEVARRLDDAARLAYRRGAPIAAAELAELARAATPASATEDARRRGLEAAEYWFVAGDVGEARRTAEGILPSADPGIGRAEVLYLLSEFSWTDVERLRSLLQAAEADAPERSELRASALADLGWVEILGGDLSVASERARRAIDLAERLGEPGPLSLALVTAAYAEFMRGLDVSDLLARALSLEHRFGDRPAVSYVLASARNTLGAQLMWSGDLEGARRELERYRQELVDGGRYLLLWEGLIYLSELESRAGDYRRALAYADELLETLTESGYEDAKETGLWVRALAESHLGFVERARDDATQGLSLAERHGDVFHVITNRSVLGFLELSLGDVEAAWRFLEPLPELLVSRGIVEPGIYPFVPDAVESLVALGRLDQAQDVLDPFERHGAELDRPLAIATAARCRGLIAAAMGDVDGALEVLDSAIGSHRRVSQPFELARTQLILGDVQRRAKQRRAARESLRTATITFERLEVPLWADRAKRSIARIGGRSASSGLTEAERQVARLVAEGRTNREVADALFVSVKTVEANLSRIYAKLGIGSRRQLRPELLDDKRSGGDIADQT